VEAAAIAFVEDSNDDVAADVVNLLARSGSRAAVAPLLARLRRASEGPATAPRPLRDAILGAFLRSRSEMPADAEAALRASLGPDEAEKLLGRQPWDLGEDERAALRACLGTPDELARFDGVFGAARK
jgi:hypothetical protein